MIQVTLQSQERVVLSDLINNLQAAWLYVRFHFHPLIACEVNIPSDTLATDDYSIYYPDTSAQDAVRWSQETIIAHSQNDMPGLVKRIEQEIFDLGTPRPQLHFASSSNETTFHLVLAFGHWITDGRGAFKIFNRILGHLNSRKSRNEDYLWGEELSRLSLPIGVASGRRRADRERSFLCVRRR